MKKCDFAFKTLIYHSLNNKDIVVCGNRDLSASTLKSETCLTN